MKKVFLNEFTGKEIEKLLEHKEKVTAIVCFGSLESHGAHCCLGPDTFVPTEVAKRVAEQMDHVVVVPCLPYGTSMHYNKYPLAITLRYETIISVVEDVLSSLILAGMTHIYMLNGHDGNIPAIEIGARNIKNQYPQAKILHMPAWWEKIGPLMKDEFEVWNGLGHGGEGETSAVMAINHTFVQLDDAVAQIPEKMIKLNEKAGVIWDISEVSSTGATGDPTKATIEKGEKILTLLTDFIVDTLTEMDRIGWHYEKTTLSM